MTKTVLELQLSKNEIPLFKQQAYSYASRYQEVFILDSNGKEDTYGTYEFVLGLGRNKLVQIDKWSPSSEPEILSLLDQKTFKLVSLNYDLKEPFHAIPSEKNDFFSWPLVRIVEPKILLRIKRDGGLSIECHHASAQEIYDEIVSTSPLEPGEEFDLKLSKPPFLDYKTHFKTIQDHLFNGDIYEVNYCHLFKSERDLNKSWMSHFLRLNETAKKPFTALLHSPENSVLCFSPERFLRKKGSKLYTQPIKGTLESNEETISEKVFAENVMIVDLCRNDLSRISESGSVKVEEFMGLHAFKNLNHIISTISSEIKPGLNFIDILRACFPMGSMTGAPKDSAMRIIEKEESFKRGLYSGSIGYYDENGDFDLNVVIRTLFAEHTENRCIVPVGGALLVGSEAESEYDETLRKIQFLKD